MAREFLTYLDWFLLPAALAIGVARNLSERTDDEQRLESGARFGQLAFVLFREEVGATSGELAQVAPILPDPDPSSAIIQAAQRGDTVAALRTLSEDLVFSVALAETRGDGADPGILERQW
jgi:hypothetical protein